MSEELHRAVGRIEGKIDGIVETLAVRNARDARVNKRVAGLERRQAWYSGAAAAVGVIAAYVFKH
jgi:hypothetical protein